MYYCPLVSPDPFFERLFLQEAEAWLPDLSKSPTNLWVFSPLPLNIIMLQPDISKGEKKKTISVFIFSELMEMTLIQSPDCIFPALIPMYAWFGPQKIAGEVMMKQEFLNDSCIFLTSQNLPAIVRNLKVIIQILRQQSNGGTLFVPKE